MSDKCLTDPCMTGWYVWVDGKQCTITDPTGKVRFNGKAQMACNHFAFCIQEMEELRRQLAAANEIIAKLPTYADTGESFSPDDDFWCVKDGTVYFGIAVVCRGSSGQWGYIVNDGSRSDYFTPAYSTEQAARAAAEAQRQGKT